MESFGLLGMVVCLLNLFFTITRALEKDGSWLDESLSSFIDRWDATAGWLMALLWSSIFTWTI